MEEAVTSIFYRRKELQTVRNVRSKGGSFRKDLLLKFPAIKSFVENSSSVFLIFVNLASA